ncbi:hypothetical protein MtrunA17_Chr4g0028011 [Medicago truncatula]|uniref:Uncharacterized protein n=1 Tax=Medicago truncatula TaxID=3880 RepID=A0A396I749_MEDTR|nr:hypothetical protein MtrunA17_Chr4g0028011 [Medicago truncatula]
MFENIPLQINEVYEGCLLNSLYSIMKFWKSCVTCRLVINSDIIFSNKVILGNGVLQV